MALVHTRVEKVAVGSRYHITNDITLDGSYASGGYAITPAQAGHRNAITGVGVAITSTGFIARWVPSTQKLQFYKVGAAGALTECIAADLSSAATVRVCFVGK